MACHILGAPNLALHLSKRKVTAVECIKKEGVSPFQFPKVSTIRFDFAPYGNMPALSVYWYDGLKESPKIAGVPEGEWVGDLPTIQTPDGTPPPAPPAGHGFHSPGRVFNAEEFASLRAPDAKLRIPAPNGSVFIGDKGILTTGTYGEVTRLLPVEKMKEYKMPPPLLTRSPGHMRDFIRACKGGDAACSNFDVAAPFVEWMLLGVIALQHEGKLEYDPDRMRITNNPAANKLLKPTFRKGWEFHTVKNSV
jgi:hypothetical protein